MSKQDRQGTRTPAGLEQKYNFGGVFSRLDGENKKQNLTMRQFAELVTETISTMQKDIEGLTNSLSESVKTLTEKDTQIEKEIGTGDTALDNKIKAYWKTIYPVGSIYVSVSANSPATLFGGTWVQLKDRFLLGAGSTYTNGNTGGAAEVTLTLEQIPSHNHRLYSKATYSGGGSLLAHCESASSGDYSYTTANRGGGKAHDNMPPYLVVYMWKRTA